MAIDWRQQDQLDTQWGGGDTDSLQAQHDLNVGWGHTIANPLTGNGSDRWIPVDGFNSWNEAWRPHTQQFEGKDYLPTSKYLELNPQLNKPDFLSQYGPLIIGGLGAAGIASGALAGGGGAGAGLGSSAGWTSGFDLAGGGGLGAGAGTGAGLTGATTAGSGGMVDSILGGTSFTTGGTNTAFGGGNILGGAASSAGVGGGGGMFSNLSNMIPGLTQDKIMSSLANFGINTGLGYLKDKMGKSAADRGDPLNQPQRAPYQGMSLDLLQNPEQYMANNPFAIALADRFKNYIIPRNMAATGNPANVLDQSGSAFANAISGNYNNLAQILMSYGGFNQGTGNAGQIQGNASNAAIEQFGEAFRGFGQNIFGGGSANGGFKIPDVNPVSNAKLNYPS